MTHAVQRSTDNWRINFLLLPKFHLLKFNNICQQYQIYRSLTSLPSCHTVSLDLNRIFLKDKNYMPVLLLFCEQSRETDFDLDLLTETRTVRSQDSTKKFFLSNTDGSLYEDGKKARFLFGEKVKDLRKLSLNLTIFPCYGLKKVSRNFNYLKSLFEICLSGF